MTAMTGKILSFFTNFYRFASLVNFDFLPLFFLMKSAILAFGGAGGGAFGLALTAVDGRLGGACWGAGFLAAGGGFFVSGGGFFIAVDGRLGGGCWGGGFLTGFAVYGLLSYSATLIEPSPVYSDSFISYN